MQPEVSASVLSGTFSFGGAAQDELGDGSEKVALRFLCTHQIPGSALALSPDSLLQQLPWAPTILSS